MHPHPCTSSLQPHVPSKYLRRPKAGEMSNCRVVENTCDWFWPNKVCLEITTSIEATPEHPVRLLCNYEGLTKPSAPTRPCDTPGRQRKRRRVQQDVDKTPVDDYSAQTQADDEEYSGDRSDNEDEAEDLDAGGGEGDAADAVTERAERAAARNRT